MANLARPTATVRRSLTCPSYLPHTGSSTSITIRGFKTTTPTQAHGPESPHYIDVPHPPQRTLAWRSDVKGILPVPRDVFKSYKTSGGHTKPGLGEQPNGTQTLTGKGNNDTERARNTWRQAQRDARKVNYTQGMTELARRKGTTIARRDARSRRMAAERQALINMPEREDERLTNTTVAAVMRPPKLPGGVLPDPDREARLAAMKANVAAHAARKEERQKDALHTLYTHAETFIVTEPQLDAAIDAAFGTAENPARFASGHSMWSVAVPEGLDARLKRAAAGQKGQAETERDHNWVSKALQERVKEVAEKLTGGRIGTTS